MLNLKLILIALFLTEAKNLIPVPLSETQREVVLTLFIMMLSVDSYYKYKRTALNAVLPVFGIFLIASVIDVLLNRFGFYQLFFLVRFMMLVIIGQSVYNLSLDKVRKLIILCCILLTAQLLVYLINPHFFASAGRQIGVQDPFTLYGNDEGRIALAYFQPNVAAHSIFFLFLSWYALQASDIKTAVVIKYGVGALFMVLGVLTGSRAFIVLAAAFLLSRMFINKSRVVLASVTVIPFLVIFFLPIQSAIVDLYLLREESNTARIHAIQIYINYILNHPFLGVGFEELRRYVDVLGGRPSHVMFIELLAAFGIFLGSLIILWLVFILVLRVGSTSLANIGFFALATGMFTNTVLFLPTFFTLLVPVLLKLSSMARSQRGPKTRAVDTALQTSH